MLQPKRTKFRKQHKGRIHGEAKGGFLLNFGSFALKATEPERVTARQIEAARRAITRHMKRQGRVWIRIFPDVPVSAKPVEVRMGKGKGSTDYWAAKVKPGRIMFEIDGVSEVIAREALRLGAMKLPVTTRVVATGRLVRFCGLAPTRNEAPAGNGGAFSLETRMAEITSLFVTRLYRASLKTARRRSTCRVGASGIADDDEARSGARRTAIPAIPLCLAGRPALAVPIFADLEKALDKHVPPLQDWALTWATRS